MLYERNEGIDNKGKQIEGYYKSVLNYGGNQMWFYNKSKQIPDSELDPIGYKQFVKNLKGQDKTDYEFEHEGCGITATVDLLSYISLFKNGYDDITNFGDKSLPVNYSDYDKFARSIAGIYIQPGSNGFQIVNGFNKYMEDNSKDCSLKYLSTFYSPKHNILEVIKNALGSDNPVMMSVFVASPDKKSMSETNRVCLYKRDNNTFKNPKSAVGQHYMNITGVIKDTNIEKTFLQVSTWGTKRYVDIDEFYTKCAGNIIKNPINSAGSGFYFTVN